MNMDDQNKNVDTNELRLGPTDLNNTNIEKFGQENIPYTNLQRKNHISDIHVVASDGFNNIGTVPPGTFTEAMPRKFNFNKLFVIILIFAIILTIGGGIYFYLSSSRKVAEGAVMTKSVTINVGKKLSLKLDDYATFKGINPSNCLLDLSGVKNDVPGKYTYKISCGVNDYKGTLIVEDKLAPAVIARTVLKTLNEDIKVTDFIVSCDDNTECNYELINLDEIKENIKTQGIYDAYINVSDQSGNIKKIIEKVYVSENGESGVMSCHYKKLNLDDYDGFYTIKEDVIYEEDYGKYHVMNILFEFNDSKEYKKVQESINEDGEITIEGITGKAYFLNNNVLSLITISDVMDVDYFGNSDLSAIQKYYNNSGYSCNTFIQE